MPSDNEAVVVYDDFSGGHWGPRPISKVPKNMWYGRNVQVTQHGTLASRAGMVLVTGPVTTSTKLPHMAFTRNGKIIAVNGTTAYIASITGMAPAIGSWTTCTGTLPGTSDSSAIQVYTDLRLDRYWVNRVQNGLAWISGANVITAVTTPVNFRLIAVRNERMFGALGRELYWSAAGDYTSWNSLDKIDLGEGSDIQFLQTAGDTLYIGTDTSLYALNGVPGESTVVRQIAGRGAPVFRDLATAGPPISAEPWRSVKLRDDTIMWVTAEDIEQNTATVTALAGGRINDFVTEDYVLAQSSSSTAECRMAASENMAYLFPLGGRAGALTNPLSFLGVRSDGYMEAHTFSQPGFPFTGALAQLGVSVTAQQANDQGGAWSPSLLGIVMWDGNNVRWGLWRTAAPRDGFYALSNRIDGVVPYAPVVSLAPFYPDDGKAVRVRTVTVYGRSGRTTSNLSVTARTLGRDSAVGTVNYDGLRSPVPDAVLDTTTVSTEVETLTESIASNVSALGDTFVKRFRFKGRSFGRGAQVMLTLNNIEVERVVVRLDTKESFDV